ITYGFREFVGSDPAELPTFVAALAVWRVLREYIADAVDVEMHARTDTSIDTTYPEDADNE
ncbi:hypothetical protein LCGC14_1547430, partial [marine sediment metagenome]